MIFEQSGRWWKEYLQNTENGDNGIESDQVYLFLLYLFFFINIFILLFHLGVTEVPMPGAFVGELFANILGDGFSRLMRGDRFYFENTQGGLNTGRLH